MNQIYKLSHGLLTTMLLIILFVLGCGFSYEPNTYIQDTEEVLRFNEEIYDQIEFLRVRIMFEHKLFEMFSIVPDVREQTRLKEAREQEAYLDEISAERNRTAIRYFQNKFPLSKLQGKDMDVSSQDYKRKRSDKENIKCDKNSQAKETKKRKKDN